MGTQANLPPKFIFSSDFGHFILKMLNHTQILYVSRKKLAEISYFLGGRPPLISRLLGMRLSSPAFGAHAKSTSARDTTF